VIGQEESGVPMSKTIFAATASVCVLAAAAKAWLGRGSGLFALVLPFGLFSVLFPYFAPALLSWGFRRRPIVLGILLALSVLASGYGLSFFYNDWYWPRPIQVPGARWSSWSSPSRDG
jgi:hypothetical protein